MTEDLVQRLFRGQAQPLVAHLLDHDSLDRADLQALVRRIESQLRDEEEER